VTLSLDTSFALRPDAAARVRDARPIEPNAEESRGFAAELARAEGATPTKPAQPSDRAASIATTLVRPARTRLSGDEAASALRAAWTEVRGEPPSDETLSILVGQWAHETGRGASMLNFNFGGLKGTGPSGLSVACSTREGFGDNAVRVVDRFRAYGSAEEGARDYVSLLTRRYPDAVSAARNGDARGFVQALKARGYFTDNEAAYSKSVQSLASLALRAGFDALGAGTPSGLDAGANPGLPLRAALARAELQGIEASPTAAGSLLGGAAFLEPSMQLGNNPIAGLPVAPGAFADEVNRAALLMSALRIGEPRPRHG
jgi:hypothetical protein